jgi:hypothetical protein
MCGYYFIKSVLRSDSCVNQVSEYIFIGLDLRITNGSIFSPKRNTTFFISRLYQGLNTQINSLDIRLYYM